MLATPLPAAHTNGLSLNVFGWTATGLMPARPVYSSC